MSNQYSRLPLSAYSFLTLSKIPLILHSIYPLKPSHFPPFLSDPTPQPRLELWSSLRRLRPRWRPISSPCRRRRRPGSTPFFLPERRAAVRRVIEEHSGECSLTPEVVARALLLRQGWGSR